MTDATLIDQFAAAVAARISPAIPLEFDLWSAAEIAAWLKVGPDQVLERYAPLPAEALRILKQVPCEEGTASVFRLSAENLDALFRKAKARTLIGDLHFHDTRHEAITRLAKRLDVLDLARMVGIRDLRILMVYYNATATEIARRLG